MKKCLNSNNIICFWMILFLSCSANEEKEWKKVAGSNNYNELENYILLNPKTPYFNKTIKLISQIKNQKDKNEPLYPPYYGRNIVRIIIKRDSLSWIGERINETIPIEEFSQLAFDYLLNASDGENQPEKLTKLVNNKPVVISRGRFLIIYIKDSSLRQLQVVINKLNKVLLKYEDQLQADFELENDSSISNLVFHDRIDIFEHKMHWKSTKNNN